MAGRVYHWKHGWIPLDQYNAMPAVERQPPSVVVAHTHHPMPGDIQPGDTYMGTGSGGGRGAGYAGKVERVEDAGGGFHRLHMAGGVSFIVPSDKPVTVERLDVAASVAASAAPKKATKADKVKEARERYGNGSPQHMAAIMQAQGRKKR